MAAGILLLAQGDGGAVGGVVVVVGDDHGGAVAVAAAVLRGRVGHVGHGPPVLQGDAHQIAALVIAQAATRKNGLNSDKSQTRAR